MKKTQLRRRFDTERQIQKSVMDNACIVQRWPKLGHGLMVMLLMGGLLGCADAGPENPLRLANGQVTSPELWQGQWVLINYWAEWCGPCREEVPELNHLNASDPQLTVYGVNYDYLRGAELQVSIDTLGIEFETLLDDPQVLLGYERATVLPMTVLLAPDGALHAVLVGPQTEESLRRAQAEAASSVVSMPAAKRL